MQKALILIMIILTTAIFSNVAAQGDKDLRDTDVKGRSNELERIDRDAKKDEKKKKNKKTKDDTPQTVTTPPPTAPTPVVEPPKDILAEVFPQIKEDYESMQNSQAAIMTTYGDGKNIDYAKIGSLSTEINKNAVRLNTNLFPVSTDATAPLKTEEKKETEKVGTAKSLRSLLIEMDEAVANVISSPMFQNLRTIEPAVSDKTKADLQQVIRLSEAVKNEAVRLQK